MFSAIKSGFTGILRFSGRDGREAFWTYVGVVLGSCAVVGVVMMAMVLAPAFAKIDQFAKENPDQVTVTRSGASLSYQIQGDHPELMPDTSGVMGGFAVMSGVAAVLLAAAVVRRLHDTGRTGLWGLPPLLLLAGSVALTSRLMGRFEATGGEDLGAFGLMFLGQMVYMASLALLAFFVAGRGTDGPNRFGPAPEARPPRRRT